MAEPADPGPADVERTGTDLVPAPVPVEEGRRAESLPRPEPVEPRPYLEIRPSESPVDPHAITRAMAHVDALLRETTKSGLVARLRRATLHPVVEWLLVSDGRPDATVRYLVGSNVSDLTEDLAGILRTGLPDSYELRRVRWHPRLAEEHLPPVPYEPAPDDPDAWDGPQHPAITPATPYVAGVEYRGRAKRKHDWQTPLQPFEAFAGPTNHRKPHPRSESRRVPLAALVETVRDADLPVVFQVVCRPYEDWSGRAETYVGDLEDGTVSLGDKVWEFLAPRDREAKNRYDPPPRDERRIEGIAARDPSRTAVVSARAVVLTREAPSRADAVARRLATDLSPMDGRYHELVGHVATDDELYAGTGPPPGAAIYRDLLGRAVYHATYHRLGDWLRRRPHESRGIVVSPAELPGLTVVDGAGLTPNGRRAVAARPSERTGLPLPPPAQLARYRGPGLPLCRPLTHDRQPYGDLVAVGPALQVRHLVVLGATGAGKSVTFNGSLLGNANTTPGPNVLFDLKGDGMAEEYLRSHYRTFGSLEGVTYFDCTDTLPALSFFDIRPLLEAGVPRAEATARKAGHYAEIVKGVMGASRFEQAVVSPQVIATHIQALFDPVHGDDAFAHRDLLAALNRTQTQGAGPPVSDEDLERHFASLVEDDPRMFAQVMAGARVRVERIGLDRRLAPAFNHVPDEGDAAGPRFDFADYLDADRVVLFDFGDMEAAAKRTLALVLLSSLWSSLRARAQSAGEDGAARPVVNLFLEEAAAIADTELVDTLLSQGRSFGLSVAMGLQFLGQLRAADTDTYYEVLNETATFLVGSVNVDRELAAALATEAMPPAEVENRLRALGPGEWLVRLGAEFADATPRPFLGTSLPAPPGHSASGDPLEGREAAEFEAAFEALRERTAREAGLSHTEPATVAADAEPAAEPDAAGAPRRVDSLLPHTRRLPDCVDYDKSRHALVCDACGRRYNPDSRGMKRAIQCCHSLEDVDPDDVPVPASNLKLSPAERAESPCTERQLHFVQVVHDARQFRTDPLEYDIRWDSMLRLQEYVGIEPEAVDELIEAGLLRDDGTHPHQLYTVTPAGREAIGEPYREGLDYGHGVGDLDESSPHIAGVDVLWRYVDQEFVADPDSAAERAVKYFELEDGHRLDVAGVDAEGEVVVCGEVERLNHDYREAVVVDYDKMAGCEPEAAIWVVMTQRDGHRLVDALREAPDGTPRVDKQYGPKTPPRQYRVDRPGFTHAYSLRWLRDELLAESWSASD